MSGSPVWSESRAVITAWNLQPAGSATNPRMMMIMMRDGEEEERTEIFVCRFSVCFKVKLQMEFLQGQQEEIVVVC